MKKLLSVLLLVAGYLLVRLNAPAFSGLLVTRGFASEVDDLQKQIDELSHLRELSAAAPA